VLCACRVLSSNETHNEKQTLKIAYSNCIQPQQRNQGFTVSMGSEANTVIDQNFFPSSVTILDASCLAYLDLVTHILLALPYLVVLHTLIL